VNDRNTLDIAKKEKKGYNVTKSREVWNEETKQVPRGRGIESGRFPTGSRLPSIRQLSLDFHCSKDTVQRALLELRHEQYLYAKPQSGYYVLEQGQHQDLEIEVTDEHASAYDDFRLCINETLIGRENYLFNYYDNQEGLEDLRQSIHKLLFDQALYCKADQLVLTSGTQQALFILSQISFPSQAKEILVEQPTYHRMNRLLIAQGLDYQTIERGIDGIDLEELESHFKTGKIKFFYTIPRFHYPLGHSYSEQDKRAILDLATKYGVYIVEDDYLGDLDSKKGQTFHYLDTEERVIYILLNQPLSSPADNSTHPAKCYQRSLCGLQKYPRLR